MLRKAKWAKMQTNKALFRGPQGMYLAILSISVMHIGLFCSHLVS